MTKKVVEEPTFVAASKVKRYLKEAHGVRIGVEALATLNLKVKQLLNLAAQAATDDRRATIKERDIQP